MKHKSRTKRATTNNSNQDLKIKGRKLGTFKSPSPRRLNHMLQAIDSRANHQDINNIEHHSLPYDEPDLYNDYISMKQDKADQFPSASPDIVSFDMFFQIPTHSMMWTHGRKLYTHSRNQGV